MSDNKTPEEYVNEFIQEFPEQKVDCVKKYNNDTHLCAMGLLNCNNSNISECDKLWVVESVIIQKDNCLIEFIVYIIDGELCSDILSYGKNCKVKYNSRYAVWDSNSVDIDESIQIVLQLVDW